MKMEIMRAIHFVIGILFALTALAPYACRAAGEAGEQPNIILCMSDDQGWGDTGYNGHQLLKTPHLDQLAREGIRFNRFYAAAPVCSPTRGSCLTGRHPFRYGVFSANVGHLPPEEITLAEVVKTRGYATGIFGKWHLGTLSKTLPSANRGQGPKVALHFSPPGIHGFDESFVTESKVPTWDPLLRAGKRRTWWHPVSDERQATVYGTPYFDNGKVYSQELRGNDSRLIMDRAISFIESASAANKPFLAVIWFHAPHLPVVAGREYTQLYAGQDDYTKHYLGSITALDEQMGRLRAHLRQTGLADNTMLWFCADNGPEGQQRKAPGSAGPWRGRKRSLYEGGVRVPGFLVWPNRIKHSRETDVACSTLDYYPTILELLDVNMPDQPQIDGVSPMPLIAGTMQSRNRAIGFESGGRASWLEDRFKLVAKVGGRRGEGGLSQLELYDLADDPREAGNLALQMPERVRAMSQALANWRASCRASNAGGDYR